MNTSINMNNLQQFKTVKNVNMLWEVLLDELKINQQNTSLVSNVRSVFENNISLFLSKANPNSGLMNLNKIFLSQIVTAVNRLFPNINQQQQSTKLISISDEVINEPYKVDDPALKYITSLSDFLFWRHARLMQASAGTYSGRLANIADIECIK